MVPSLLGLSLTFAFITMSLGGLFLAKPPRYDDGHTDSPLLWGAFLLLGTSALGIGLWLAWRAHARRGVALCEQGALVGRLSTTWARVLRCDVVGSESSDGT
ncbi:hypothetical protein [Nannocystis pusilla]|uniref:hypothetical protein n=1 Tax=Nannocystis pusilla TaxID=889268 RepID=UPI003B807F35